MKIIKVVDDEEKKKITRAILEALPEWFGIIEAREKYILDSVGKDFFCASSLVLLEGVQAVDYKAATQQRSRRGQEEVRDSLPCFLHTRVASRNDGSEKRWFRCVLGGRVTTRVRRWKAPRSE